MLPEVLVPAEPDAVHPQALAARLDRRQHVLRRRAAARGARGRQRGRGRQAVGRAAVPRRRRRAHRAARCSGGGAAGRSSRDRHRPDRRVLGVRLRGRPDRAVHGRRPPALLDRRCWSSLAGLVDAPDLHPGSTRTRPTRSGSRSCSSCSSRSPPSRWGMFVRARRQLVLSLRERAERAEAEQQLRVEQARQHERARIAREMHDVLAHRISLLSMHAGALEFRPDAPPEEIARAAGDRARERPPGAAGPARGDRRAARGAGRQRRRARAAAADARQPARPARRVARGRACT